MKQSNLLRTLALTLTCAALAVGHRSMSAIGTLPSNAANLVANAGVTFTVTPTGPNVALVTADGVVAVSVMGNCIEHAEVQVNFPTTPGQPILLSGSSTLTSSDGTSSLKLSFIGTATPDPANPHFLNNSYQVTVTGGTGAFASAKGSAQISEVAQFNSTFSGGTAAWTMKGYVVSAPAGGL